MAYEKNNLPIVILSIAAMAAAGTLGWMGSYAYLVVLGITNPVIATVIVVVSGFAAWRVLLQRSWIAARASTQQALVLIMVLGMVLPIPVIVVDLFGGFSPDINVPGPDAFLFYPSIALLAEMVFHVIPLAAFAFIANRLQAQPRAFQLTGFCIALAIEPVLQVVWGSSSSPLWANAYVGLHLLIFNAIGLYILRRHGLLAAYLYRLSYYSVWHLLWGYLRMEVLFSS